MRKIKFVTDSTADLAPELVTRYNVTVIPLVVIIGGTEYHDGVDINTNQLYEKIAATGTMPKTAAVAPLTFDTEFKKILAAGFDIIYIGIGSKLSATFANAMLAVADIPESAERIRLVDSGNLSTGISLTLLHGIDYANKGHTLDEVVAEMQRVIPKVRAQFVVETLDYLYKGGRCSGLAYIAGKLVRAHPFLQVIDGKIENVDNPKGKIIKALNVQLDVFLADHQLGIEEARVFVTHSQTLDAAKYYVEKIQAVVPHAEIIVSEAGCVVSSHCGAGTIGILYIKK